MAIEITLSPFLISRVDPVAKIVQQLLLGSNLRGKLDLRDSFEEIYKKFESSYARILEQSFVSV